MGHTHYVAIAIIGNNRFQAMCNPIKCGWAGSVTTQLSLAESEKQAHCIETLVPDTEQHLR
jgi:hypothetical protein